MFGCIKKMFIGLLSIYTIRSFGESLVSNLKGPVKRVSLNNHPCQVRPTLLNMNSDETLFYPLTVSVKKCGGSCNPIDDLYTRVCVPNKVKNTNVKIFNLISGVNETRFFVQHESCKCKCELNESVFNSKQKWDHNKRQCECKELDD